MRAFLGFPIAEPVRDFLAARQSELLDLPETKPVAPEKFHVTVKFLGDITQEQRRQLTSGLQRRLPTPGPLEAKIGGYGAFPNPSFPRVIWAGIKPRKPLEKIFEASEAVGEYVGLEPENHDYVPHVTLMRLKEPKRCREAVNAWLREEPEKRPEFSLDRLILYESELTDSGPIYNEKEEWML